MALHSSSSDIVMETIHTPLTELLWTVTVFCSGLRTPRRLEVPSATTVGDVLVKPFIEATRTRFQSDRTSHLFTRRIFTIVLLLQHSVLK